MAAVARGGLITALPKISDLAAGAVRAAVSFRDAVYVRLDGPTNTARGTAVDRWRYYEVGLAAFARC